ncbi:MAG: glycine cleavage system protein GcvH [Thermacetogeniaceae bacterium]
MAREQDIPQDLLYDRNNYWVKVEGSEAVIGLTAYGQSTTGEVIYLELPSVGSFIKRGEGFGSIESGKWVGKLVAPVTGEVIEVNSGVAADPEGVNRDPYKDGWLIRVRLEDPSELDSLMRPEDYREWVREQERMEMEEGFVS